MQAAFLTPLVANQKGEIFDLKGYAAVGRNGSELSPLTVSETLPLPHGSELMFLQDRRPILYNRRLKRLEVLNENPYAPGEPLYPVAAFNSPGFVVTHSAAYIENEGAKALPLFSYGAVGWHRGRFRSAVVCVDREKRQDLRRMPVEKVVDGIRHMQARLPDNRLRAHLENCALGYGCPAGKNFFLGRHEAPLPTSRRCNARCLGCLSLQADEELSVSQERIRFTPEPEEITAVALVHIERVSQSIVSFGQGCEGDPLLAAHVIEPAIRQIRAATRRGTIHMNTNGSLPRVAARLFEAGLDSIRISINSVRKDCYEAYFRPQGYAFEDVLESIDLALEKKKFVSLNYLNCPGFTDTPEEKRALVRFLETHPIHMIQWRNLNIDPLRYIEHMNRAASQSAAFGMGPLLTSIREQFPNLKHGYFNPPKEKFDF